jgi:hypothetical protein
MIFMEVFSLQYKTDNSQFTLAADGTATKAITMAMLFGPGFVIARQVV